MSDATSDLSANFSREPGTRIIPCLADSLGSFIDRSFGEALPFQYIREFTTNAIEAGAENITIEPDWIFVENQVALGNDPVYRWSIWDDGCGMDFDQIMNFRKVFNSTKGDMRGKHSNFGMGAKVAGYPCSPNGMIIMSWVNGVGHQAIICQDENGEYGMIPQRAYNEDTGEVEYHEVVCTLPLYDEYYDSKGNKQKRVHGTLVVFTGTSPTDNTYLGPEHLGWKSSVNVNTRQINSRYARLHEQDVTLHAWTTGTQNYTVWPQSRAEASAYRDKKTRFGQFRKAHGACVYWDMDCSDKGTVQLSDAKVHWWAFDHIDAAEYRKRDTKRAGHGMQRMSDKGLNPETGLVDTLEVLDMRHSFAQTAAITGTLYKGEIYDLRKGVDARHHFNLFGLHANSAYSRVVLMVEPKYTNTTGVFPNTVRSGLVYGSAEGLLPWGLWGCEFRKKMPAALRSLQEDAASNLSLGEDFVQNILKELRASISLYDFSPGGHKNGTRHGHGKKVKKNPLPKPSPGPRTPRKGPADPNRRGNSLPLPRMVEIPQEPNPIRPVEFHKDVYEVVFYLGHPLFESACERWVGRYSEYEGLEDRIRLMVYSVYTNMVMTRVVHALSLIGKKGYNMDDIDTMLTTEGLMMAILGNVDADARINQKTKGLRLKRSS